MSETEALLREWWRWWNESDDAPAKIGNALHVRTALHLHELDGETGTQNRFSGID